MINYAPIIDTSVPGFLIETDVRARMVKVHFKHNIAVSKSEVKKMKVIIKPYSSVSQTSIIAEGQTAGTDTSKSYHNLDKGILVINPLDTLNGCYFEDGVYYKVQIAYVDKNNNVGPYSSVGIARCLGRKGETGVQVEGLTESTSKKTVYNTPKKSYVGRFNYDSDIVENIYQYRFYLEDTNTSKKIKDTGWVMPVNDSNNKPIMVFNVPDELKTERLYKLYFGITTVNGYSTSVTYDIKGLCRDYPNTYKELIEATQDATAVENGFVQVALKPRNGAYVGNSTLSGPDTPCGNFYLLRREIEFNIWETLTKFTLTQLSDLKKYVWKDFSVEAGKTYIYAVQQWYEDPNSKKKYYSEKVISQIPITVNFEHMFLSDGKRQLAIKFNPKVSNLKTNTLETKIDTIGGKYPFFSRNGTVGYKEIPLSGLISYHMDSNSLFLINNELHLAKQSQVIRSKTPHQELKESSRKISIKGLDPNKINQNQLHYVGSDFDEKKLGKIVAYRFFFYNVQDEKNLIDIPWQPPMRDERGKPIMEFTLKEVLKNNKIYGLNLKVTTSEGKTYKSFSYKISNNVQEATTDLTNINFKLEKDFKTLVYDWLNDGNPKFFRSPAEGNYILRLMNVSLAPNDTLGRMLHSFSATGYEMAECSIAELKNKKLIKFNSYDADQNISKNSKKIIRKTYQVNRIGSSDVTYVPILIRNSTSGITFKKNLKLDTSKNIESLRTFLKKKGATNDSIEKFIDKSDFEEAKELLVNNGGNKIYKNFNAKEKTSLENLYKIRGIDTKGFYVWLKNGEPYADTSENLKIYIYGVNSPQWKGPLSNLVRLGRAQKVFWKAASDWKTPRYIQHNRIKNLFYAPIYSDKLKSLGNLNDYGTNKIKECYIEKSILRKFYEYFNIDLEEELNKFDYKEKTLGEDKNDTVPGKMLAAYGFGLANPYLYNGIVDDKEKEYIVLCQKNWYKLYNNKFSGKISSIRVDCQSLTEKEKLSPLNSNIEPFYGDIIVVNTNLDKGRASNYKEYNMRSKYGKIEKISLYAQEGQEDPWAKKMYLFESNENGSFTFVTKEMQRLFRVNTIEYLFAGELTDDFIPKAKEITKSASEGIWYKSGEPLSTSKTSPGPEWKKMSQKSKRNWTKTKLKNKLNELNNNKTPKPLTSQQIDSIATSISQNLKFNNSKNPLEITNHAKVIETMKNPKNLSVYLYFKDGTVQEYTGNKKGDRFSLEQLKDIRNFDQIIKIRPSKNTKIKFTGLFTYATSPRLGRFRLGNSRLGDEHING